MDLGPPTQLRPYNAKRKPKIRWVRSAKGSAEDAKGALFALPGPPGVHQGRKMGTVCVAHGLFLHPERHDQVLCLPVAFVSIEIQT